jgi:hypothetical protein
MQPIIEIASACAYFQQGHEFKNCPFVDDKLKRLMKKKLKTFLWHVVLSTRAKHVGVHVQQIQPQPSLVTNPTSVSQHLSWQ